MSIAKKLSEMDEILSAAISSGSVELVAVSKYASDEQIIEAYQAGIRIFGENYIVPALKRREKLLPYIKDAKWHLLGAIQSNKLTKAVGNFDLIQSVHSFEIAEAINQRAQKLEIIQDILIQINATGDKNGFTEEKFLGNLEKLLELKSINLKGLMVMAPHEFGNKSETIFDSMRQLIRVLESRRPDGESCILSMGMTNDFAQAVERGSTMIRIGRGIFGT